MTARVVTIAGWVVLATAVVVLELRARLGSRRLATLGAVITIAFRTPLVRFLALAGWVWLGWHLFVR
jgi:hypothetical protein